MYRYYSLDHAVMTTATAKASNVKRADTIGPHVAEGHRIETSDLDRGSRSSPEIFSTTERAASRRIFGFLSISAPIRLNIVPVSGLLGDNL